MERKLCSLFHRSDEQKRFLSTSRQVHSHRFRGKAHVVNVPGGIYRIWKPESGKCSVDNGIQVDEYDSTQLYGALQRAVRAFLMKVPGG